MPRIARLTHKGGFYHIFNRGLEKKAIFRQDKDYHKLLTKLSELLVDNHWTIYAYCLLPNHFHLLVEEKKLPIAKLIGRLFTSYGVYFNKKYKRQGPLFGNRFKSKLIQKDSYFFEVSRYIHLNPVRANLVKDPLEYPYSSLREYTGSGRRKIINLEKVTTLLGDKPTRIKDYLSFVNEGIQMNLEEFDPFKNNKDVLGSAVFATHRKMV